MSLIIMLPLTPIYAVAATSVQTLCFETAWKVSTMADTLSMPGVFGWLSILGPSRSVLNSKTVHLEDLAVGLIICCHILNETEILTIGVVPLARRLGLGSRLVNSVQASGTVVSLEVAVDNTAALALYRKLGFKQIGKRPGYYQRVCGAIVDALLLRW